MSAIRQMLSRRKLIVAGGATATLAAFAAVMLDKPFGRRYPRTAYDDLIGLLNDRDSSAAVGRAVLASVGDFDKDATAKVLRQTIGNGGLENAAVSDAMNDRLIEASGWVLPASFAMVCALAADSA